MKNKNNLMEKFKNNFLQFFKSYQLISYTLLFVSFIFIYIFLRFMRPRLPKDIPYSLNDFSFYLLIGICFIYIYIIYKENSFI